MRFCLAKTKNFRFPNQILFDYPKYSDNQIRSCMTSRKVWMTKSILIWLPEKSGRPNQILFGFPKSADNQINSCLASQEVWIAKSVFRLKRAPSKSERGSIEVRQNQLLSGLYGINFKDIQFGDKQPTYLIWIILTQSLIFFQGKSCEPLTCFFLISGACL